MKAILIVEENLKSFQLAQKSLNTGGENYILYHAATGEQALDMMHMNKINLVITDITLPDTTGPKLLKIIRTRYPSAMRLLMSDKDKDEHALQCIETNLARMNIQKPFNQNTLVSNIEDMFKLQEALSNDNILFMINSLDRLPALPSIYAEINELIEDEADISLITGEIEKDHTLCLRLLRLVNSTFYGVKTASVKTAILNLGLVNIKNIILLENIFETLGFQHSDKEILWKHASSTNKLLVEIYKSLLKKPLSNLSLSAGLLHDIGKIVLIKNFPRTYEDVMKRVKNGGKDLRTAEKEQIKYCHEEVGAYLLNWWGIPNPIIEAALFHHNPFASTELNRELVCAVHLADHYSWMLLDPSYSAPLVEEAFSFLGITEAQCEDLAIKNKKEFLS